MVGVKREVPRLGAHCDNVSEAETRQGTGERPETWWGEFDTPDRVSPVSFCPRLTHVGILDSQRASTNNNATRSDRFLCYW